MRWISLSGEDTKSNWTMEHQISTSGSSFFLLSVDLCWNFKNIMLLTFYVIKIIIFYDPNVRIIIK